MSEIKLLPCPFCGSKNIDPEGWASAERSGPACDDCAGTADTIELWNSRPLSPPEPTEGENEQFDKGVAHAIELLAKVIGVTTWVAGDGSEDYDSDVQQTLMNILIAKGLYDDETGRYAALSLQDHAVTQDKRHD